MSGCSIARYDNSVELVSPRGCIGGGFRPWAGAQVVLLGLRVVHCTMDRMARNVTNTFYVGEIYSSFLWCFVRPTTQHTKMYYGIGLLFFGYFSVYLHI